MAASYIEQPENPTSKNLKPPGTPYCIDANEPPLSLRQYKLALQYYTKLISCSQNLAYNCIMEIRYKNLFEN